MTATCSSIALARRRSLSPHMRWLSILVLSAFSGSALQGPECCSKLQGPACCSKPRVLATNSERLPFERLIVRSRAAPLWANSDPGGNSTDPRYSVVPTPEPPVEYPVFLDGSSWLVPEEEDPWSLSLITSSLGRSFGDPPPSDLPVVNLRMHDENIHSFALYQPKLIESLFIVKPAFSLPLGPPPSP